MAKVDNIFSAGVDRAFVGLSPSCVQRVARSGETSFLLRFASAELSAQFNVFLAPLPGELPQLEICFATSRHVDLSDLVPRRSDAPLVIANDQIFAFWQPGPPRLLHIFDVASCRGVVWLADDIAPAWLRSRPHLPIMHAFFHRTPWIGLHGAAVGRAGRMLLLAGTSRTGKSTAALACARAGWDYAGDDVILLHSGKGQIGPLVSSARLRDDMSPHFPDLLHLTAEISRDDGDVRHEIRLQRHLREDQLTGGKLATILLPRRQGAAFPAFARARPLDAMSALLGVTLSLAPGWAREVTDKVMKTSALTPVFFVDTGRVPEAIPDAFQAFLEGTAM